VPVDTDAQAYQIDRKLSKETGVFSGRAFTEFSWNRMKRRRTYSIHEVRA
jgi:hypothetical protein